MRELVENKLKTGKMVGIMTLTVLVTTVVLFVIAGITKSDVPFIVGMLSLYVFIVMGAFYLAAFMTLKSNMKWLRKIGKENTIDDISLEYPQIKKGKVYCGSQALYSKKNNVIIPYSEFAWVHSYIVRSGFWAVSTAVMVHTKDRRQFIIQGDIDEFKWVLERHVIPVCPNLIIGNGKKQLERFNELNPRKK